MWNSANLFFRNVRVCFFYVLDISHFPQMVPQKCNNCHFETCNSRNQWVTAKQRARRPVIWCGAWVHSLYIIVWCAQTWPRWEKRGREISSSCFCHLQLILPCPPPPPPLSSSSSPTAHRIWPGPSLFSTTMFFRRNNQTLPKCSLPSSSCLFSPLLLLLSLCFFHTCSCGASRLLS